MTLNWYRKDEKCKINYLLFYLNKLVKDEKSYPKQARHRDYWKLIKSIKYNVDK